MSDWWIEPIRDCERLSDGRVMLNVEKSRERNGQQIAVNGESRQRNK